MREIVFDVTINAEPLEVFRALTEKEPMEGWWAECYLQPKEGSTAIFFFRSAGAYKRMTVEKLVPENLVEWKCVDHYHNGTSEWVGTEIRFQLSRNSSGGTDLHFVHGGWSNQAKMCDECVEGWRHFLIASLKPYLETGKGQPFEAQYTTGWRPAAVCTIA